MEAGRTPQTPVVDEPVNIGGWEPHNFEPEFMGPITLETALAHSINTVAARLADEIGREKVADVARRLGVTSKIGLQPSMALGAVEVSPLEMAQAYAAFSNGGIRVKAHGINRIRTRSGKVLYEWRDDGGRVEVINNPPLSEMNQMMRQVLVSGTGRGAAIAGYDLAGKTGTSSDFKDAWFVGYTGGFATAVWVGKDDNTPMHRITGGSSPASIWRLFMQASLPRLKTGAIPGGIAAPSGDPIGDILNQADTPPTGSGAPPPEQGPGDPAIPGSQGPAPAPAPGPAAARPPAPAPARPTPQAPPPSAAAADKKKNDLFY
jgi:penicillin-binding protein 1A